jgi:hypothetical protein
MPKLRFTLRRVLCLLTIVCIVIGAVRGIPNSLIDPFLAPELFGVAVLAVILAFAYEVDCLMSQ